MIVAFIPDLLFGSNVVGALTAAGHEVKLVSALDAGAADGAELLIVDLTADVPARLAALPERRPATLAFYSHVETEVREQAEQAGVELVVPRSRMAREGAGLVQRLLAPRERPERPL